MNYKRKASALKKYADLSKEVSPEELIQMLSDAGYTPEEQDEIANALVSGNDEQTTEEVPDLVDYEEYRVTPKYETVYDALDHPIGRKLVDYEKDKKIRTTRISPDKAEMLNSQSENTGIRLFEVE